MCMYFRIYWKDFGDSKRSVISLIRRHHTKEFSELVKNRHGLRNKFFPIDWTPCLLL